METTPHPPIPVDQPGLHLLVGRPGTGKTTAAVQIIADASAAGREVRFFFLEAPEAALASDGLPAGVVDDRPGRRLSEALDAVRAMPHGGLFVLDYWQLLQFDARGMRADLSRDGLTALKDAAHESGVTVVVASQLSRDFDAPGLQHSLPTWCAVADSAVRIDRRESSVQEVA